MVFSEVYDIQPENRKYQLRFKSLKDKPFFQTLQQEEIITAKSQIEHDISTFKLLLTRNRNLLMLPLVYILYIFLVSSIPLVSFVLYIVVLFTFIKWSKKSKLIELKESSILSYVEKYAKYRNVRFTYKSMAKEVIDLIYKIENDIETWKNYKIFSVFYKKKVRTEEKLRPLVNMHPAVNILFRVVKDEIKNSCKYNQVDIDLHYRHLNLCNYLETQSKYIVFFLDNKKAFDSIDREYIKSVVTKYCDSSLVKYFDFLDSCVYKYNSTTTYYKYVGIPQGSPFSTLIFNLCVYDLTKDFEDVFVILKYVDDVCLLVKDFKKFEYCLEKMLIKFKKVGLYLNYDKTYYLTKGIDYTPKWKEFKKIEDNTVEKYLGKYISQYCDDAESNFKVAKPYLTEVLKQYKEDTCEVIKTFFNENTNSNNVPYFNNNLSASVRGRFVWYVKIYSSTIKSNINLWKELEELYTTEVVQKIQEYCKVNRYPLFLKTIDYNDIYEKVQNRITDFFSKYETFSYETINDDYI